MSNLELQRLPADADRLDADLSRIADVFTASVHGLAASHYDEQQRNAWAPRPPDVATWRQRLRSHHVCMAWRNHAPAGFVSWEDDGHIDHLYVHPDHARHGVASSLLRAAADALRTHGVTRLYTEASLVARPVFMQHGFEVVEAEQVERNGAVFRRFRMARTNPVNIDP